MKPPRHFATSTARSGTIHIAIGGMKETLCGRERRFGRGAYGLTAPEVVSKATCLSCKSIVRLNGEEQES